VNEPSCDRGTRVMVQLLQVYRRLLRGDGCTQSFI